MAVTQGPKHVQNNKYHQYQIVGRHLPTESEPEPTVYRMKLWSTDKVRARSKFWYFLRKLKKVKKANGQIIACNEIFEEKPTVVDNYGIWIRYQSRTGFHNMYKEYRDVTLNGAVHQMYDEMAGRHRVRKACLQIIKARPSLDYRTATVPNELCQRDNTKQFHADKISFPLTRKLVRASSKSLKTTFKYVRPSVAM